MRNDPYKEAAATAFGVAVEDVTPEQRAWVKQRAFMHMYHSPRKMSEFLNEQRYPNPPSAS